jgi:uncharacterized membrane protein YfcA
LSFDLSEASKKGIFEMNPFGLLSMSFGVGILVGLTSMGGAALMTPLLMLFAGMHPVVAVGTDLAYGSITKIVGAWMHWRQKTVDLRVALLLACGSIPGGTLGFLSIQVMHSRGINSDLFVKRAIGCVLVIGAVVTIVRTLRASNESSEKTFIHRNQVKSIVLWGFIIGFAVGLTSVGSGSLLAPFLMMLFPNNPSRVVGTDVFHAAMLVSVTAMLHGSAGHVDWPLVPIMLAGSIPGVLVGSYLAPRLPSRPLRVGIGGVLFATGYQLVSAH